MKNLRRSTRKRTPCSYLNQEDRSTDKSDSDASPFLSDDSSVEEGKTSIDPPNIDQIVGLLAGIMDLDRFRNGDDGEVNGGNGDDEEVESGNTIDDDKKHATNVNKKENTTKDNGKKRATNSNDDENSNNEESESRSDKGITRCNKGAASSNEGASSNKGASSDSGKAAELGRNTPTAMGGHFLWQNLRRPGSISKAIDIHCFLYLAYGLQKKTICSCVKCRKGFHVTCFAAYHHLHLVAEEFKSSFGCILSTSIAACRASISKYIPANPSFIPPA